MARQASLVAGSLGMALALVGCAGVGGSETSTEAETSSDSGGSSASADAQTVGISMPGVNAVRWQLEAAVMEEQFAELGYATITQFANDDPPTQVEQVEDMITNGVDALIVTAVDAKSLSGPLADAEAAGIEVLAYTRLLQDTDAVDYYSTFDYKQYGAASAQSIVDALGVSDGAAEPFNIEVVNGSATDSVAFDMWEGYLEVMQPYIDSGVVQVPSDQNDFDQSSILNWTGEGAQSRIENLVTAHYSDGTKLDAVWVPFDGMTRGVISGLKSSGYDPTSADWPILPGGDGEIDSIKAILAGEQYSSAWIDVITLAEGAVQLVDDVLQGNGWPDTGLTFDNGSKEVPTSLFPVVNVTKENVQEVLVDSGFYSAEDLGL